MHWKIPWYQKSQAESNSSGSFYSLLRSLTGEIRRQGDPPVRDAESFSHYICDLCHGAAPVSALRQCVICGRWACTGCWKDEYYVCSSCNGIIRLHQIEILPKAKEPCSSGSQIREPEEGEGVDTRV